MSRRPASVLATLLWALLAQAEPRPAAQPGAAAVSPGAVALLVLAAGDPSVQARLTQALRNPSPDVRAVAARVAAATNAKGQIPTLLMAIPQESDGLAGSEMVRALIVLQGEPAHAFLRAHALRIGSPAVRTYAELIACLRLEAFLMDVPTLVNVDGMAPDLGRILATALTRVPERNRDISQAILSTKSLDLLEAVLAEPIDREADYLQISALSGDNPEFRERVVWHMVGHLLDADKVSSALVTASLPGTPTPASTSPTWEDFGRDIVARTQGRAPGQSNWVAVIAADPDKARPWAERSDEKVWTKAERDALEGLATAKIREARKMRRAGPPPPRKADAASPAGFSTLRWTTPGLGHDLLRAAGCQPSRAERDVLAVVEYRLDGMVKKASLGTLGFSPGCEKLARAAVALDVSRHGGLLARQTQRMLVIVLDNDVLDCAKDWPSDRGRVPVLQAGLPAAVEAPTPVSERMPHYPLEARSSAIQGEILVEAVVTTRGCIVDLDVVRSIPALDLSAISAVRAWRFKPSRLADKPVPVRISVGVSYQL